MIFQFQDRVLLGAQEDPLRATVRGLEWLAYDIVAKNNKQNLCATMQVSAKRDLTLSQNSGR